MTLDDVKKFLSNVVTRSPVHPCPLEAMTVRERKIEKVASHYACAIVELLYRLSHQPNESVAPPSLGPTDFPEDKTSQF